MKTNYCNDNYCSTKQCKPCCDKCRDKQCKSCCDKQCQEQSQGNVIQAQEQGDISQTQGDQTESQGDQSATQGDQSQTQGDQTESQGDQSATQGDQSQTQGDQMETQGDQSATQGDQSQTQGDQMETQGDQSATQGDQSQTQGDQMETQGDQTATQGDQSQTQGDQMETQGDQSATQGDLTQTQGGQTQGDQTATQGDQTQGDQMQMMTGHGGQIQGAQTLTSNPTISTPVNVSGVNLNVTVTCCDDKKKDRKDFRKDCNDCQVKCRESITTLLSLINTLSLAISDPSASLIEFFHCELDPTSTIGNLGNVTDCTFGVVPESPGNEITFITDTLDALCIEPAAITPNLFELLLSYLQSVPDSVCNNNDQEKDSKFVCDCCFKTIELQLQAFFAANVELQINIGCESFTGFIFKICNGIIYLVDNLIVPTIIYAIPICKILSYQPQ